MAKSSGTLDKWREYFLTANSDIFDIIERAIMVAASDCPKEFKLRRDRIAEMLFTCKVTKCSGCDKVELAVPRDASDKEEEKEDCKIDFDRQIKVEAGTSKESKVNSNGNRDEDDVDDHADGEEMDLTVNYLASTYSYGDAEALTDEIEEESQTFVEVLRIKEILENSADESDSVLFDSLRRLQLMGLSVEVLKATEIGKAVNALRRQGSKQIRQLAKTLVDGWRVMVDEWMNATSAIANDGTPESGKKSDVVDEEEGLPSPPLDEGAFFTTQLMELSQFFDGMDDDGNPRNSGEFNKNRENGRKPTVLNQNVPKRKQQHDVLINPQKDQKGEQPRKLESIPKQQETVVKKQAAIVKPSKTSFGEYDRGRPTKPSVLQKVNCDMKPQQKSAQVTIQKRDLTYAENELQNSDEAAVLVKLEASKRKLQERYQEAEKAKKQRTIQVMELHDLPKQGKSNRNSHWRPGNHGRHWANGRR